MKRSSSCSSIISTTTSSNNSTQSSSYSNCSMRNINRSTSTCINNNIAMYDNDSDITNWIINNRHTNTAFRPTTTSSTSSSSSSTTKTTTFTISKWTKQVLLPILFVGITMFSFYTTMSVYERHYIDSMMIEQQDDYNERQPIILNVQQQQQQQEQPLKPSHRRLAVQSSNQMNDLQVHQQEQVHQVSRRNKVRRRNHRHHRRLLQHQQQQDQLPVITNVQPHLREIIHFLNDL